MPSNEDIKKVYRDSEKNLPSRKCHRGKQPNQKLKPYIVLQYLLKYTDADHVASAFDIIAFLQERGIDSDRRSIYNDVKEINYVYWLMENEGDIEEAKEVMGAYIDTTIADDEAKKKALAEFENVKVLGKGQTCGAYLYVRDWFLKKYPKYHTLEEQTA